MGTFKGICYRLRGWQATCVLFAAINAWPQATVVPTLTLWNFQQANTPITLVNGMVIHPADEYIWFLAAQDGLFVTRDAGKTWSHPFSGIVLGPALKVDPTPHDRIFAGTDS